MKRRLLSILMVFCLLLGCIPALTPPAAAAGVNAGAEDESTDPGKVMDGVHSISCSGQHSGAITDDGALWMWGDNTNGQLGVGNEDERLSDHPYTEGATYSPVPIKVMDSAALPSARRAPPIAAAQDEPEGAVQALSFAEPDGGAAYLQSNGALGAASTGMSIPGDAFYINGNAFAGYLFNSGSGAWEEADQFCRNLGGHLATLATPQEENLHFTQGPMYIGGRRDSASGRWYWITGEPCGIGTSDDSRYDCLCTQADGWRMGQQQRRTDHQRRVLQLRQSLVVFQLCGKLQDSPGPLYLCVRRQQPGPVAL